MTTVYSQLQDLSRDFKLISKKPESCMLAMVAQRQPAGSAQPFRRRDTVLMMPMVHLVRRATAGQHSSREQVLVARAVPRSSSFDRKQQRRGIQILQQVMMTTHLHGRYILQSVQWSKRHSIFNQRYKRALMMLQLRRSEQLQFKKSCKIGN